MKKILTFILFLNVAASGIAQESQTRNVSDFTGVKVAEGIDVYLIKGDKESVKVEVSGTSLENVLTEVSGSYLKVHMRDGNYRGHVDAKVYVTYVKLEKLSASSAGSIFSRGPVRATSLEISASSAANIEIEVEAEKIEISASSAGEAELTGKTKSLSADASSAGEIDAYDLVANSVVVEASSAGTVKINAVDALTAHASSGGSIRYRGNPSKSITNSSSGGSVRHSN